MLCFRARARRVECFGRIGCSDVPVPECFRPSLASPDQMYLSRQPTLAHAPNSVVSPYTPRCDTFRRARRCGRLPNGRPRKLSPARITECVCAVVVVSTRRPHAHRWSREGSAAERGGTCCPISCMGATGFVLYRMKVSTRAESRARLLDGRRLRVEVVGDGNGVTTGTHCDELMFARCALEASPNSACAGTDETTRRARALTVSSFGRTA